MASSSPRSTGTASFSRSRPRDSYCFQLNKRRASLGFSGFRHDHQRGDRGAIAAHANFINGLGQDEGIKNLQEFQQRTPTIMGRAVGNLTHHHVMIKAVPLGQTQRQEFEQGGHVETAEQAHDRGRLARLAGAHHLAQLLQGGRSELLDDVHDAVALLPPHAAEEPAIC